MVNTVTSAVRQGRILSPILFAVFINVIIVRLKDYGFGCAMNSMYIGCIMQLNRVSHKIDLICCFAKMSITIITFTAR